jgi:hypothetical protein
MKKFFWIILLVAMATAVAFISRGASAAPAPNDTVDIVGTSSSPAGHSNPQNWFVDSTVSPGSSFTVDISVSIDVKGNTTSYPRTVSLGQGPGGSGTLGAIADCVFSNSGTVCTRTVTVTAPAGPGAHLIKIQPTAGTGNSVGLNSGNGLNIHYSAVEGHNECVTAPTSLSVDAVEVVYHQPSATLTATLTRTSDSSAIEGKSITFNLDGAFIGAGTTDSSGTASYVLDTSSLSVGDHTIDAFYDGEACAFEASTGSASLCVRYGTVSFKPPITPTGPALFRSVKTIPVKIVVTDYFGAPVANADAHVFFAKYTSNTTTESDAAADPLANTNGDSGNLMRYDASGGQYIFNWNTTGLTDGKHRIHIVLGEGSCAAERTADVTFKRK